MAKLLPLLALAAAFAAVSAEVYFEEKFDGARPNPRSLSLRCTLLV
jgi:hypothetical protein